MKKPFAKLFKDQQIINYKTDMSKKAKQAMQERILKAFNSENLWKGNASASLGSHMDAEYGIIRVQVWKNTILTDDQCKNTIGGATGITSLINYNDSTYSYPQPNHEWIPELGNEDTISDTGSDTAVNLTYIGSPDIGYFRYGEQ